MVHAGTSSHRGDVTHADKEMCNETIVIISLFFEFETRTEETSMKEIDSSEVTNFISASLTLFTMKDASRGLLMTAKSESCTWTRHG